MIGKSVFVKSSPQQEKHKNKGSQSIVLKSLPLFLAFLSQSFKILFVAVHLFFLRGSFVSSVVATLSTQSLFKVAKAFFYWVSTATYCLARLLSHQATGLSQFLRVLRSCAACSILPQAPHFKSSFYFQFS